MFQFAQESFKLQAYKIYVAGQEDQKIQYSSLLERCIANALSLKLTGYY